jgi:SacI homology domain
MDFGGESGRA